MKLVVNIALIAVLAAVVAADPACIKQTLCTCETAKGMIDLTPLTSKTVQCNDPAGTYQIQYSPCSSNNTQPCHDAMVCKKSVMGDSVAIGMSSGENFVNNNGSYSIVYPGENNTTSTVKLVCSQDDDEFNMIKASNNDDDSYVFEFKSRYACVGGPPKTTTSTPKTTKSTPKTTKSTPKTTKSTPKTTKSTPKTTKSTPKTTKSTPKTTPKTSKSTTPKNTKTTPKTTSPKSPNTTPKSTKHTSTHPTTTHNGASSIFSTRMAGLIAFVALLRQFF